MSIPTDLPYSFLSTDRTIDKSFANGMLADTLEVESTMSKPLIEFNISISKFEVKEALEGKLFNDLPLEDLKTVRDLMNQLIDMKARNNGLSLREEIKTQITELLLLIVKKTGDSL